SPDGSRIATAAKRTLPRTFQFDDAFGRRICLWDGITGEMLRELDAEDGTIYDLAFSPDGKRLAAGCLFRDPGQDANVCVAIYHVASGKQWLRIVGFESDLERVRFSADGKQLHVNERMGRVAAWDAATGKQLFVCKPPQPPPVQWGDGQMRVV